MSHTHEFVMDKDTLVKYILRGIVPKCNVCGSVLWLKCRVISKSWKHGTTLRHQSCYERLFH